MKKAIIIFIITCTFCMGYGQTNNTYFISVKYGDQLFRKTRNSRSITADYLCGCYARKHNVHFLYKDTIAGALMDTLPQHYYSLADFAKLASKKWETFTDNELWRAKIYIVEETRDHKYVYNLVKFAPIAHEE